jgi:hypothetical protein
MIGFAVIPQLFFGEEVEAGQWDCPFFRSGFNIEVVVGCFLLGTTTSLLESGSD